METEAAYKAGDVCFDCQKNGLLKHLRYFRINLHGDTILKCESSECMYPYNDEMFSSEEEEETLNNSSQTSSLSLINDLIQQYNYEERIEDTIDHIQLNDNMADQVTHFDITFLDDIHESKNENLCKPEFVVESTEYLVNGTDVDVSENQYFPLPTSIPNKYEISTEITNISESGKNDKLPNFNGAFSNFCVTYEVPTPPSPKIKECKPKINIQSVETVKYENPLYHDLPTSSQKFTINNSISCNTPNLPQATIMPQKNTLNPIKTTRKTYTRTKFKSENKTNKEITTIPQTCDIPKADILKANAFLKQLATMDPNAKAPRINTKCKRDKKIEIKAKIENETKADISSNNDTNYSFDKISQLLSAKQ